MKSFVCNNGTVLRPVKKRKGWHYQVFHPARGLLPISTLARTEEDNRSEITAVGKGMGGGALGLTAINKSMKQFKLRRKITLNADGPVENVEWSVPPSRHYRLVVERDNRSAWIEYNDAKRLPTVRVSADGKRTRKKLRK